MSNHENTNVIPDEIILSKIYFIWELKVMIESDLAELYGVETCAAPRLQTRGWKRL